MVANGHVIAALQPEVANLHNGRGNAVIAYCANHTAALPI